MRASLLTFILFLSSANISAQDCELRGTIVDEHGHILPGATAQILNDNSATSTNESGQFKLTAPCGSEIKLRLSFIGFGSIDTSLVLTQNYRSMVWTMFSENEHLHEAVVEAHKVSDHASVSNEEVSANFIRENDQGTLMKTLEQLPGVNAINVGVGISKPVLRGMSLNRVVVTANGVRQEGQQWGADHGLEMDQFAVEHVEVIKGPATIKYGSGSAAGVVNVLPLSLAAKDSLEGQVTGVYKSNNHHLGTSAGLKWNKNNWFGAARATYQEFGDYRVPADSFVYNTFQLPIINERLKNTAGVERDLMGELGIMRSWGITRLNVSTYRLEVGIFPGAIGIPRSYNIQDDGDPRNIGLPYQNVAHDKVSSHSIFYGKKKNHKYTIIGAWQRNLRDEQSEAHSHGSVINTSTQALLLDLNTYSLELKAEMKKGSRWLHEWGINGQRRINEVGGFEFFIPDYTSADLGGFYLGTWRWTDRVEVNGGLRLGYFQMEAPEALIYGTADSTADGSVIRTPTINREFFNWSAAIGFNFKVNSSHQWKLNFNKSFRNPSIAELGSNGVHHGTFRHERGDPNIDQEQGVHADLGYQYNSEIWKWQLAGFASYYDGFIYLRPTPQFSPLPEGGQLFQYTQNDAVFVGGEASVNLRWPQNFIWKLGADYVWNYNTETFLPLPFTPPGRLLVESKYQLQVGRRVELIEPVLAYRYTMAQNRVDRNEPSTPSFHLFQAGINVHLKFGAGELRLRCVVQNLMDVAYLNHLSRYRYLNIPEQGRNVVLGIDIPIGAGM